MYCIQSCLFDNQIISDIEVQANHFHILFVSLCTPLNNSSTIPGNQTCTTNTRRSLIKCENKDINIIRSVNVYRTYGHDNVFNGKNMILLLPNHFEPY